MTSVARRPFLTLVLATAAVVVGGCLSPTLPLPPPSPPTVSETDTEGVYRLTGTVTPNSHVTAWNFSTDLSYGQQTSADGAYDFIVLGSEGDAMSLSYSVGTDESQPQDFVLEAR